MSNSPRQHAPDERLRDANEHLTMAALEAQQRAEDLAQRLQDQNKVLMTKQGTLRELASQLTVSEQRERKRLAAELHDYLAQMLVLGRLKIGQARHQMASSDLLKAPVIKDLDDILTKALVYTRTLMAELSPPVLQELGLPAALKWLAEHMDQHNLTVAIQCSQQTITLPEDQAILLYQSVRELLINVTKHAKTTHATVSLAVEGSDRLLITVQDHGCGFDLGASAGKSEGEHFGLLSVNERMEAMGGWLSADSAPDRGTTITLGLPLKQPIDCTESQRAACTPPQTGQRVIPLKRPSGVRRILLVDDHLLVRQGLRAILDGFPDMAVIGEAGNGVEAVKMAADLLPDVVLMDINMPGMDGIQATQQIKAAQPAMVVIGLSVNQSTQAIQAMMEAGASDFLSKDAAPDLLHQMLATTPLSSTGHAYSLFQPGLPYE